MSKILLSLPPKLVYRIKDVDNGDWLFISGGRIGFINRELGAHPFANHTAAEMVALTYRARRNETDEPFNFEIVPGDYVKGSAK